MKNINDFQKMKEKNIPICMVTCYDYWSAQIIQDSDIDAVLVGDSAAMVMHGYKSTINAEVNMMLYHIAAVRRGMDDKFLIADLPFLAHRKNRRLTVEVVDKFLKAGANAIKIEGADSNIEIIKYLVESGVPVMGHLGLLPQSINSIGSYRLQAADIESSEKLLSDAKELQDAGCFSIVLEMIPSDLAKEVTKALSIPTIGIGAGKYTSGQILVLHDLLGLSRDFNPKFLRKYLDGYNLIKKSLNQYSRDVKRRTFPSIKESY